MADSVRGSTLAVYELINIILGNVILKISIPKWRTNLVMCEIFYFILENQVWRTDSFYEPNDLEHGNFISIRLLISLVSSNYWKFNMVFCTYCLKHGCGISKTSNKPMFSKSVKYLYSFFVIAGL